MTSDQIQAKHCREGCGPNCLVCDEKMILYYTDLHGEARCGKCGVTYQTGRSVSAGFLERHGMTEGDIAEIFCTKFASVAVLRDYWQEAKTKLPFGTFFEISPITARERSAFKEWLRSNAEKYRHDYADVFAWDRIASPTTTT